MVVNFPAGSDCRVDLLSEESGIVPEDFSHSAKIRRASAGMLHVGNSLPTGSGHTKRDAAPIAGPSSSAILND